MTNIEKLKQYLYSNYPPFATTGLLLLIIFVPVSLVVTYMGSIFIGTIFTDPTSGPRLIEMVENFTPFTEMSLAFTFGVYGHIIAMMMWSFAMLLVWFGIRFIHSFMNKDTIIKPDIKNVRRELKDAAIVVAIAGIIVLVILPGLDYIDSWLFLHVWFWH